MSRNVNTATAAWGEDMPDWVRMLAEACDLTNQSEVARRVGYQPGVINQTLQGKYKGCLPKVETAVRGALQGVIVRCPVLGDIPAQDCLGHQRAPFVPTNTQRVDLYKACRANCPHSRLKAREVCHG